MASVYLRRTQSTPTDNNLYTFSCWVKRGNLGSVQALLGSFTDSSNRGQLEFTSSNQLNYYENLSGSTSAQVTTTQVFRDTSAWYHIVLNVDLDQATDSDRIKIYVNGTQITSFSTATYPSQGATSVIANCTASNGLLVGGSTSDYSTIYTIDGYMAEVVLIDGQQLDPTSFGEFDEDSGIWKPISVSGLTFGTNGFYLDFENSGSLGADVSGNGNSFTVKNLTSIDQSTDTCTNNFATFNALNQQSSISYSNGNTTFTNSSSANRMAFSNIGVTKGKWYAEIKVGAISNYMRIGIADISKYIPVTNAYLTNISNSANYSNDGVIFIGSSSQGTFSTFTTNDIVNIALDMDNGYVYFGKNGTWQNSGDPTSGGSGTGGFAISNYSTETYCFGLSSFDGGTDNVANANFGNGYFGTTAVSSAQNPDDGIGIFEYDVPAGYRALCTKSINAEEYS